MRKSYVGTIKVALDRNDIDTANAKLRKGMTHYSNRICKSLGRIPMADAPLAIANLRAVADALERELSEQAPDSLRFVEWLQNNMNPDCNVRSIIPFGSRK